MLVDDGATLDQVFSGVVSANRPIEHGAWVEAVTAIRAGIREGRADFVLTGDRQVGKTTLARWCEQEFGERVQAVQVGEPFRRPTDRAPVPVFVRPLAAPEMSAFLAECLRRWDLPPDMLSPRAGRRIVRLADGRAGIARTLFISAARHAAERGAKRLTPRDVGPIDPSLQHAADPSARSRRPAWRWIAVGGALAGAAAGIAAVLLVAVPHLARQPRGLPPAQEEALMTVPAPPASPPAPPTLPPPPPPEVASRAPSPVAPAPSAAAPTASTPTASTPAVSTPTASTPVASEPAPPQTASPGPTPAPAPAGGDATPAASPPLSVAIRFARDSDTARLAAADLARRLGRLGITVDAPTEAAAGVRTAITYTYEEDRAAAVRLQTALGDSLGTTPTPVLALRPEAARPGSVQITIAGQGGKS